MHGRRGLSMGPLLVGLMLSFSEAAAAEEMWFGAGYELRYQGFFFGDEDEDVSGRRRRAVTIPAVMHGIRIQDQSGVIGAALGGAGAAEVARQKAISDAWEKSDTKVGDTVEYSYERPSPATGLMQNITFLFAPIGFDAPLFPENAFDGTPLPTSVKDTGWYFGLDWDIPLPMFALKITDDDLIVPKFGTWLGIMELEETADSWYMHGGLDLGVTYQRYLPFNLTALLTADVEVVAAPLSLVLGEPRWFNGRLESELVWAPVKWFWLRAAAGAGFQPMHFEPFDSSMAYASLGAGFAMDLLD